MTDRRLDFVEDAEILERLSDPLDIEAFSNLMVYAHEEGVSAADFVREEPDRTSRRTIRKLCLKNHSRSLWVQISSSLKNLWKVPATDAVGHPMQGGLFGQGPVRFGGEHGRNGSPKRNGRGPA